MSLLQKKHMKKNSICIVGSGIAGSTLAKHLSKIYSKVIIVEAGDLKNKPNEIQTENSNRIFGLPSTRSISIGGTSNLWHGVLGRLNKIDFKKRLELNLPGWPIKYEELNKYYAEAESELGLKGFNLGKNKETKQLIQDYNKDINLDFSVLSNNIFRQKDPSLSFSKIIRKLQNKNNVELLLGHTALQFKFSKSKVKYLICGTKNGLKNVKADKFILCCGALESPRTLLNSRIQNGNIGKNLIDHPMGNLCQIKFNKPTFAPLYSDMKLSKGQKIKSGIVLEESFLKRNNLPNHNFYFRPSFTPGISNKSDELKNKLLLIKSGKLKITDFIELAFNLNVIIQILIYKLSLRIKFKYADIFFVCEQLPNEKNYVTLSEEIDKWGFKKSSIKWQYSEKDHNTLKNWFNSAYAHLPHDDFKITTNLHTRSSFSSAAHHLGTCRMGASAIDSVVNSDLRVHELDNLFVCDGSVFPSGGNVNPGLTICALALRLAEHLKK